ncbi:MAG: galactokinase [Anaerolineae bacterium]
MSLFQRTLDTFRAKFSPDPQPRLFRAPGRVNLIGEHTDYNDGFVLPAAIDYQVVVAARERDDARINVYALDFGRWDHFDLDSITRRRKNAWSNYIRGVAWSLQQDGHALVGMDAVVAGDVPIGAGLSSSAAIEVAIGYTLLRLGKVEVDRIALALAAQRAENDFVGMRCGIMDQFISCLGQVNHALLIDCRDLSHRPVPLPPDAALIIADSGVRRGLVESEYNARRAECEAAARHFDVPALRDLDEAAFDARAHELPSVVRRRARHVITENARTLAATQALDAGDLATFGELMDASHTSLRDDFEVSCRELDMLVEIARSVDGVYGARLTGAGFGGCIVAIAQHAAAEKVATAIYERYPPDAGREAKVYICQPSDGASEVISNTTFHIYTKEGML